MISANYDIDSVRFGEKVFELRIYAIKFFSFLRRPFNLGNFRTGIIKSLNRTLLKELVDSEGRKILVRQYDEYTSKKEISFTQMKLKHYKRMYYLLEEVKFFHNSQTEEIIEKLLMNYYAIESEVRNKAFLNNGSGDENLRSFASDLSLGSLTAQR